MKNQVTRQSGPKVEAPSGPELNLEAVYAMIFRRWKMMLCFLLVGVAAAAWIASKNPVLYSSEARLFVMFVLETRSVGPAGPNAPRVVSTDSRGENIISSEMEILSSTDLTTKVAEKITPERILQGTSGEKTVKAAAAALSHGLEVENPKKSNVIRLSLTHTDPTLLPLVLNELINAYREKHIEIRQNGGPMGTYLKEERDKIAAELAETENQLRQVQAASGVVSVEEAKHDLVQQVSRLTEELHRAETQLAEARAMALGTSLTTNTSNPETVVKPNIPSEVLDEYRSLLTEEDLLRRQERYALRNYTAAHPEVKRLHGLLQETRKQMAALANANPGLAVAAGSTVSPNSNGPAKTGLSQAQLETDPSRIPALEAKLAKLKAFLEVANGRVKGLVDAELQISQLKRKKDLQESKFKNYQTALDQLAADEAMGLGKVHNIDVVQSPTTPLPETKTRYKLIAIAFAFPTFAGIGLAILLELFLNQTVRRVSDVASKITAPVFIALPDAHLQRLLGNGTSGRDRKLLGNAGSSTLPGYGTAENGAAAPSSFTPLARQDHLGLAAFFDTLQDRLIAFFDKNGISRRPKLIGVTGCQPGAGTTTVVTGLAEAFAAIGEGDVLVVDMTHDSGTMHHFTAHKSPVDLSDALDEDKRRDARVQQNLYVVAEAGNGAGGLDQIPALLRKRVMGLIPQLKLSDYDYIIFDLPPMSQTSSAPRLGRLMDLVLLVAQGDRTQLGAVQQSSLLLEEAGATVGVVLNRTHNRVPKSLRQGLN